MSSTAMRFGYVRTSTYDQDPTLQRRALEAAGIHEPDVFVDQGVSGSTTSRPALDSLLSRLRPGDELVVWRLDRLGRDLRHLLTVLADLDSTGIRFRSLTEQLDTSTPMGRAMLAVCGIFAQFEADVNRERIRAGVAAARANGRVGGRPKEVRTEQLTMARRLLAEGSTVSDAARACSLSRQTLYRYHVT